MSNQACPGVSVAAIGKVGVHSVSGGYSAANTFSDDRIDDVFRRRTVLKFTNATEKSVLQKSDPLTKNFKISLRKDSCGHRFTY